MSKKYTAEELKKMTSEEKDLIILSLQDSIDRLNENFEKLIEQIRIANQQRFGRHSEKMEVIDGQLNIFNEAEYLADESIGEPEIEDVLPKEPKKKKVKGKRNADLDQFEQDPQVHDVSKEELDAFFGEGNWKEFKPDVYKRLRHVPATWITEVHTVKVYVGTGGDHQDEFYRGDRPKDLLRNSILTPSLAAGIINGKYLNSIPFYRIEQEFVRQGLNISRQDMANWCINLSKYYFAPFCERMKYHLLRLHVNQCDETPVQVLEGTDKSHQSQKAWMWVHRSGELYRDIQIILFEFQRGRAHEIPLEYYKDFKGVLVTDGLQQYHLVDKKSKGITNANCWTHARRDFTDAVKAASKDLKKDPGAAKLTVAYQALKRIGTIFHLEGTLKELSPEERLKERQKTIKPLVDEYFAWVKEMASTVLPKCKTADGLNYSLNQEQYLRVFLNDGEVPIDNSASERGIRTFCVGKKNWLFYGGDTGAEAGANIYSITETAKANNLRPYPYVEYLLTELPKLRDDNGEMDADKLDALMPWSKDLPAELHIPRR